MLNIDHNHGANGSSGPFEGDANLSAASSSRLQYETINCDRRSQIEMILPGEPLERTLAERVQARGGLRWVNFYPGSLDLVVVGCNQFQYPTHESVHTGLMAMLEHRHDIQSTESTRKIIRESKVDGFRDGNNYVIRIEDHAPLLRRAGTFSGEERVEARKELKALLAKYNRAIELAGIASQESGGEVFLQAEGASQVTIAKMLGRLHQASSQDHLSGPAYIARSRQTNMAGMFYYSLATGTRYKVPDQLLGMKELVNQPEKFLDGLVQMRKWMTTDNQRGAREAQFLLIDPRTSELVSRGRGIDGMMSQLEDLIHTSELFLESWDRRVANVYLQIEKIGRELNSLFGSSKPLGSQSEVRGAVPLQLLDRLVVAGRALEEARSMCLDQINEHIGRFDESLRALVEGVGHAILDHASVEKSSVKLRSELDILNSAPEQMRSAWDKYRHVVAGQVEEMAESLRTLNHPDFRRDDMSNPVFVQKISDILRRGATGIALGPEFSTPVVPLEIGHFKDYDEGKRHFVHSTSNREHERLISWVQRHFPSMAKADWCCLGDFAIALTFDHHPSSFVRLFGDIPYKSYVVLFGELGKKEQQFVIRENEYAEHTWPLRGTERVQQLLKAEVPVGFSSAANYLTALVHLFQSNQYFLAQALGRAAGSLHSVEADKFELIQLDPHDGNFGDYEFRPFYAGKRVDRESLMTWSRERIEGALKCVGEIIAKSIVKQSPSLSFSSLIITSETEGTRIPLKMMLLSESETFCHSLDIKSLRKYMATIPTLYGAHIATWVESFCQGEFCRDKGLTAKAFDRIRKELVKVCLTSFEETYRAISGAGRTPFAEALQQVRQNYDRHVAQFGPLPEELYMPRYLGLTEQAATLSRREIQEVSKRIRVEALQFCRIERNAVRQLQGEPPGVHLREEMIDQVYSLVKNHFSDSSRFNSIMSLLTRDEKSQPSRAYSVSERLWLYTIVDVGAWLSAIRLSEKSTPLLQAAIASANVETFLNDHKITMGLNLPSQTLVRFYEAVEGLRQSMRELPSQHPKRMQLRRDIGSAYALRGLNKEI